MSALLYGIGIGPGDPELITVKGLRLLRAARWVFLPATRPGQSFAREIAAPYLDPSRQRIIELLCPPAREREAVLRCWETQAQLVATTLTDGTDGVFLAEGDPSLYSTFQYLAAALRRRYPEIEVHTVPGVTSVSAAAALARLPLALWDEQLTVLPAVHRAEAFPRLLEQSDAVAVMKPGSSLPDILNQIDAYGATLESALVRRAGRPEETVIRDSQAMRAARADYFSLLLIRKKPQ